MDVYDYHQKLSKICGMYYYNPDCEGCPLRDFGCGEIGPLLIPKVIKERVEIVESVVSVMDYKCSNCGYEYGDSMEFNFCPICGNRRDKEEF